MTPNKTPQSDPPPKSDASAGPPRGGRRLVILLGSVVAVVVILAIVLLSAGGGSGAAPHYVGQQTCVQCHKQEATAWTGSDHDWAMRPATAKNVLGNFDNAEFNAFGVTSRFSHHDGKYYVNTDGPDGKLHDFPIAYTFGHYPLQQYLIELDHGRIQALSIAWDTRPKDQGGQRWYHLYQHEKNIDHNDELHWTKPSQNWNAMCADCHSTDLQKGYDAATDTYHTTWSTINVGCESCHGPGSEHVAWANASSLSRWLYTRPNKGLTVNLQSPFDRVHIKPDAKGVWQITIDNADNHTLVETCAPCHARRSQISTAPPQGHPLLDSYVPERLRRRLYYPDGQIHDEVYVYGSFVQSLMYRHGVRCTDCHDPHTTKVYVPGNALCIRCHQPDRYNTPAHFHHKVGSTGAQCINCHMPTRTYMGVDVRRDHSLRIPRPDLTMSIGVPNACNQCHADKTPKWAADAITQWFGPKHIHDPHYGQAIAAGRDHAADAEPQLESLIDKTTEPNIARATAVSLLGEYPTQTSADAVSKALHDDNAMVRLAAVQSLSMLDPKAILPLAMPMLDDPILAVRSEAARVLSVVPHKDMTDEQVKKYDAGIAEFDKVQQVNIDRPASHLNLGSVAANQGDIDTAVKQFQIARKLNPIDPQPKWMLAQLYRHAGRDADAKPLLEDLVRTQPQFGDAYYSLGLLLAGEGNMDDAVKMLGEAAKRMSSNPRVFYNYGLALQKLGRDDEAETALVQSYRLDNQSPDVVNALSIFYVQHQRWDDALKFTEYLARLVPNDRGVQQRLVMIRQMMQR